jgi:hypothetical protein
MEMRLSVGLDAAIHRAGILLAYNGAVRVAIAQYRAAQQGAADQHEGNMLGPSLQKESKSEWTWTGIGGTENPR